jgi:hypothetical protein
MSDDEVSADGYDDMDLAELKMADNTDLIARLLLTAETCDLYYNLPIPDAPTFLRQAADALAARDAACGHLPNELVAKSLASLRRRMFENRASEEWTGDEIIALRAATFEVTE